MKQESQVCVHPLAQFAANLQWQDVPKSVQRRAEELCVDWFGSVLAGQSARPVRSIAQFALMQGGAAGSSEVIGRDLSTSSMMAALANAAASHMAEQDDVHNGSVFHPAAVVFPAALSVAQSHGSSGSEFLAACVAGYEVGIRVGEFLGRSHYKVFHTTATAGTLAAAAAVGRLLDLTPEQMQHAFGSAGTQSGGLWEFLRTGADSKQLHAAHAAAAGLMAAHLAQGGFTGAQDIFSGPQGMAAGMSNDADSKKLTDRLGTRWATAETSFKWHASCRHTHPAADALLQVMQANALLPHDLLEVTCHVHQAAIDVLGPVTSPVTVHQSKFSMGTVLALVAQFSHAGLAEFDAHWLAPETVALREKVHMSLDAAVDAAYPQRWIGKVTVRTTDGRTLRGHVEEPKGDPGNTLSREEVTSKALRLAAHGGAVSAARAEATVQRLWCLSQWDAVGPLLA
jgi:2-methylcitrate dehydratase PrpD